MHCVLCFVGCVLLCVVCYVLWERRGVLLGRKVVVDVYGFLLTSDAKDTEPEGQQGVHPTPWLLTVSYACYTKDAEPEGR